MSYAAWKLPSEKWLVKVWADGHHDLWDRDYFEGFSIQCREDGTTVMEGELVDLPAVYGFINRLRDTMIFLHSLQVRKIKIEEEVFSDDHTQSYGDA